MGISLDAKDLKETIKDFPVKTIVMIILVATALLLFLPDFILAKIFLLDFRNGFGTYIGLIFVVSLCTMIIIGISHFMLKWKIKNEFYGKKARDKISELSKDEKSILLYMLNNRDKDIFMPSTNGCVLNLKSMLMISFASNTGTMVAAVQIMPFVLEPWTIEAINKNRDLFKGINNILPREIARYSDIISS